MSALKYSLGVRFGRWQITNGRQRQRRPVQTAQVLARQRGVVAGPVRIHPVALERARRAATEQNIR